MLLAAGPATRTAAATLARLRLDDLGQVVGVVFCHRQLVADVLLDVRERHDVGFAAETYGIPRRPGTRGPTNAVHVIFRVLREVEVDDVLHVRDVQPA